MTTPAAAMCSTSYFKGILYTTTAFAKNLISHTFKMTAFVFNKKLPLKQGVFPSSSLFRNSLSYFKLGPIFLMVSARIEFTFHRNRTPGLLAYKDCSVVVQLKSYMFSLI